MSVLNLFKYYAPKYKNTDNLSFYSEGSIYFQKPMKFNDPWDCKAPPITIPRHINLLKDIWFNMTKKLNPALQETGWQNIEKKLTRYQTKQLFDKYFKEVFENPRSRIGIFSLSFVPDCELMWSHYASSHSGYMLHFQIDTDQYSSDPSLKDIGIPIPVIYKSKREIWKIEDYFTDKVRHFNDLIRFKSNAWKYECELRLLNVDKCGFIKTPSNWLKSIIIGIETDTKLREKLKEIGNALNISVLSSVMNKKEYKIDIPGLGINGNDGGTSYKKEINSKKYEPE